ncbi:MAG: hypothetical protein HZB19_10840 [Chloroflexi bacterium]|nr:hypothetical protein [Chloroflexota bacterium]
MKPTDKVASITGTAKEAIMENRLFKLWVALTLIAIANIIIFDAVIITSPDTIQVKYTPDDAYYYLSLARNFVHYHSWTFDSGVSKTSGFHPMLAYILALLYALLRPNTDGFVRISLLLSSIFTLLSAFYLLWMGWKQKQLFMLASLAVIISWRNILINSVSGVEWPLIVFIIVLFCSTLAWNYSSRAGKIFLFVLGILGSLTRSDFGILTFAFFCASLILWRRKEGKGQLAAASLGAAGALLGVGLLLLHNYLLTGLAVQSSALMKNQWITDAGSMSILRNGLAGLIMLLILPLLFGFLNQGRIRGIFSELSGVQKLFGLTAIFNWMGYAVFYSRVSDVQPWYSANIVMSVFVFLSALWYSIQRGIWKKFVLAPHLALLTLFAVLFLGTLRAMYPVNGLHGIWPHQQATLEAGKYLQQHPLTGRVGGWNMGIINYYQGGEVINLDGVVNNDIHSYAVTNTTVQYMREKNIEYLLDFDNMFRILAAQRGGYDDPQFLSHLQPVKVFDEGQYPIWKHLTLYKIGR